MKKRWLAIPALAVIALGIWSILTPGTAIVEARVSLTSPYGDGFLAQVRTTKAFQTSDGGWIFEVWSKCSLSLNQIVDIGVPVSGIFYGGQPNGGIDVRLYKLNGTSYVPWDGC